MAIVLKPLSELLRHATQAIHKAFAAENRSALTIDRLTVLSQVINGPQKQRAIVEATGIDRSTLSELIRAMVKQGLVTSRRDQDDQRATLVSITVFGRREHRTAAASLVNAETALLDTLDPQHRAQLIRALVMLKLHD